ncbi:MAG: F0F1 ATP synthase subunit A [Proteobacteria bacterium]|nr:F0F1 ATP synthase subunit A [Pseudomonadota bacterium]
MSHEKISEEIAALENSAKHEEETSNHGEKHSPLAQFEVKKIIDFKVGGVDLSFTNSALYMVIATFLIITFMLAATRKKLLIPSRLQVVAEGVYNFINDMILTSIGEEGKKFFPLIFSLFTFILLCNVLGMTPYSFTPTSQIIVTLSLAMVSFFAITIFAILRNGIGGFLHMFLPSGVPTWMAPVIFIIELFSFLIRPITLSVRLFANLVAGHVLLKVVAGFVISLGVIFGTLPFLFSVLMTGFELFVAVLQAYIFSVLVCVYFGETVKAH